MVRLTLDGVSVVMPQTMSKSEALAYLNSCREKLNRSETLTELSITLTGNDDVQLEQTVSTPKFERIRRITGYLTGDLNRWNNAKRAEEHERVKHG